MVLSGINQVFYFPRLMWRAWLILEMEAKCGSLLLAPPCDQFVKVQKQREYYSALIPLYYLLPVPEKIQHYKWSCV